MLTPGHANGQKHSLDLKMRRQSRSATATTGPNGPMVSSYIH